MLPTASTTAMLSSTLLVACLTITLNPFNGATTRAMVILVGASSGPSLGSMIEVFGPVMNATGNLIPTLFGPTVFEEKNFEPELVSARPQYLIERAGFKYIEYDVITSDGYILHVIRLVNPLADPNQLRRPPVVIFCPLFVNLAIYLVQSNSEHRPLPWPRRTSLGHDDYAAGGSLNRSIAFALANQGFDVWLASTRGADRDNSRHVNGTYLNVTTFWDFSLDEFSNIDVPTVVDFVLHKTECKQLIYVGFSQSVFTVMVHLAHKPSFAHKLHTLVAIGPTLRQRYTGGIFPIMKHTIVPFVQEFMRTGPLLSLEMGHASNGLMYTLYKRFPAQVKLGSQIFSNLIFGVSGPPFQSDPDSLLCATIPTCVGARQALHWSQQIGNDNVCAYDHGALKNLQVYGQPKAPAYDLSRIKLDNAVAMFVGTNDVLTAPKDYKWLKSQLKVKLLYERFIKGYNHGDLSIAKDNDKQVVEPMIELLIKRTDQKHAQHGKQSLDNDADRHKSNNIVV